ncbi:hypothetical protein CWI38_1941p0010 [Hamiltosporidium tvaerminnensis]|uniref:Uncharacterized protein n=1 Tax=Hamiltosporidium tvaerminnensis TaxID=1176355 RepID=A0A4Q9LP70_9MICR|nr:hypothetical protein CWI38_1941p0010 [Hamiltosporidium tvaerminnensis]
MFFGDPSKEEIDLYLSDIKYSLINNPNLKNEIITSQKSFGNKKIERKNNFFDKIKAYEFTEPNVCFKNIKMNFDIKKTSNTSVEDIVTQDISSEIIEKMEKEFSSRRKSKKKRKIFGNSRNGILQPKNLNVPFRIDKSKIKEIRDLTRKNTLKNTGYKFVRLESKLRTVFYSYEDFEHEKNKNIEDFVFKKRKVRFIDRNTNRLYHNEGDPIPIILQPKEKTEFIEPDTIETVFIENILTIPRKVSAGEFIFKKL